MVNVGNDCQVSDVVAAHLLFDIETLNIENAASRLRSHRAYISLYAMRRSVNVPSRDRSKAQAQIARLKGQSRERARRASVSRQGRIGLLALEFVQQLLDVFNLNDLPAAVRGACHVNLPNLAVAVAEVGVGGIAVAVEQ